MYKWKKTGLYVCVHVGPCWRLLKVCTSCVCVAAEPIKAYCGNAQVEDKEECDPGALGKDGDDPCCDKETCLFKRGAVCRCFSIHYHLTYSHIMFLSKNRWIGFVG